VVTDIAKADFGRAKELYPSTGMGEKAWLIAFDANPDIMWSIIGDVYDFVKAEQERDAGVHRLGRRPQRSSASLDEVYATVFPPQYTVDPFGEAMVKLLAGRSVRAFAARVPMHHSHLSRLLTGERALDLTVLERIALAAKVPPAYFVEWRALYVGQLITRVLSERPNLSVKAVKAVRRGRNAMGD
jgi:hypothetical protein